MKRLSKRRLLVTATLVLAAAAAVMGSQALAGAKDAPGAAKGLGQLSGLLPRNKLTVESAIQVNLSNETVRLPLYPGDAPVPGHPDQTEKVWYILLDASDSGLAHDLGRQPMRRKHPVVAQQVDLGPRRQRSPLPEELEGLDDGGPVGEATVGSFNSGMLLLQATRLPAFGSVFSRATVGRLKPLKPDTKSRSPTGTGEAMKLSWVL